MLFSPQTPTSEHNPAQAVTLRRGLGNSCFQHGSWGRGTELGLRGEMSSEMGRGPKMRAQEHQRLRGGWEGAVMRPGAEGKEKVRGGPGVMSAPKVKGEQDAELRITAWGEKGTGKEKGPWA